MHLARVGVLLATVTMLAACSSLPSMDLGSAGCQNARGIGPSGMAPGAQGPVLDGVVGKSPAEAASVARDLGHTVVFNVQIPGFGECWCVPPPEGTVVDAWWGQRGALWLQVEGVDEGHSRDNQPPLGWGC